MGEREQVGRRTGLETFHLRLSSLAVGASLVTLAVLLAGADPASAIPAFARREGQPCTFCHSAFPKLNTTGMEYKSNGFRFPGEIPQNVWDLKGGPPVAVIAEIEAFIDHSEPAGGGNDNDEGPTSRSRGSPWSARAASASTPPPSPSWSSTEGATPRSDRRGDRSMTS